MLGDLIEYFIELEEFFVGENDFGGGDNLDAGVVIHEFFPLNEGSDSYGDFDSIVGLFVRDFELLLHLND